MKILFVCTGNTCRSPMAEAIAKQKLKSMNVNYIKVYSAGVMANLGDDMTKLSRIALKKLGIKNVRHKSNNINTLNLNEFKVYALSNNHKKFIKANCISADEIIGKNITDPFGFDQGVYDECALEIEKFVEKILAELITVEP